MFQNQLKIFCSIYGSITANVLQACRSGKKASLNFRFKTEPQRHKNNFKLNLNLPFLQTCVSISAILKTEIMLTILKLEKEDIKTSKIGCNVRIAIDEKTEIVFSRDALDELINDYEEIKKTDEIHRDGSVSVSSEN